ncbi:BglG family transcription antiterminator [Streptococcus equi]|uniref:BglG family transcription antiterminator n=1 Tax=Streptococcus equi TaxID=1336 RepID=UPI0005B9986F|nr:BglG family transcription antiterminator [Streptococcus equi]KIS20825.1 PTS multi-domain regulator [Streptococcus equi subsp. zooepidemicus SzAM35]MCD3368805.1 BglG family transcription antiterminator [Streptococcus equi subsp. zooepidemicus]MCD3446974.1 BglG family transcription antiterminator [Streptococcus equi subsp. zooepidemicus]MCD3448348.1 BglG family transcription antiterminator [Streptococcus equi subsp. zooepidemicus]VTP91358.1 PTS multi-domain regulator [Streptococcus equi subsp
MVDSKAVVILMTLMTYQDLSLYELSVKTKFTIREIKDRIDELNDFLAQHELSELQATRSGYRISQQLKDESDYLFTLINAEQVYLSQAERINLIYLYTFCRRDFVSNSHYQDFLKVSKNTALTDIKALRQKLADVDLELRYTRASGYTLVGDELDKHRLALAMIATLLKSPIGLWALDYILASWHYQVSFEALEKRVSHFYQTFQMSPILDRLQACLYAFIFILCRYQRRVDRVKQRPVVVSEQLDQLTALLVSEIMQQLSLRYQLFEADEAYFQLLLAGCFEGQGTVSDDFFESLTAAIVDQMQGVALLSFSQSDQLKEDLKRHLIPAYYRLRYGLPSDNDYTLRVKDSYSELFDLVKQSLEPLAKELDSPIPDSEIAYFVLHFGGYLKQQGKDFHRQAYRAVIVCPNGVSSSLMIKEHLKLLFPDIAFRGLSRLDQLGQLDESCYDLVFSTIRLETDKPFYLVPMIMTDEQAFQLVSLVNRDFPDIGYRLEVEELLHLISSYAVIHQKEKLRFALQQYLRQDVKRKDIRPVLQDLITKKTYQSTSEQLGWREAIYLAAQPLLESGQIQASYQEAMIAKVEEFGPFINLGKGIAIPHARPEDGVNQVGMSMLVLEHPIYLLDDPKQEIRLLICIAAIDNETHLKALSRLTTILRDNEQVKALLASKSFEDIKTIIAEEA